MFLTGSRALAVVFLGIADLDGAVATDHRLRAVAPRKNRGLGLDGIVLTIPFRQFRLVDAAIRMDLLLVSHAKRRSALVIDGLVRVHAFGAGLRLVGVVVRTLDRDHRKRFLANPAATEFVRTAVQFLRLCDSIRAEVLLDLGTAGPAGSADARVLRLRPCLQELIGFALDVEVLAAIGVDARITHPVGRPGSGGQTLAEAPPNHIRSPHRLRLERGKKLRLHAHTVRLALSVRDLR